MRQAAFTPRNVLVLSGGGANGAFTAGVLSGWTAAGTRPSFDIVTGISTGALIAPLAFLGSEYDKALMQDYTGLHDGDIFRWRWLPALLWSDSLADSAPLRRRIEAQVTPELLTRIAHAHAQGRRLYVGTTDLVSKRLVVWDLGAIAAGDNPEKLALFRKVLLASASFPGLLPPVAIDVEVDGQRYTELHVDGGVSASLFLRPSMLGLRLGRDGLDAGEERNVYVIVAGKLRPPARPVERRLFRIAGESLEGVVQAQFEGNLLQTYLLARFAGARFALAAVPEDVPEPPDSMSFDPRVMRDLFDAGRRFATAEVGWRSLPPGLAAGEQLPIRGGVRFTIQQEAPDTSETANRFRMGARWAETGLALRRLWERVTEDVLRPTVP